MVSAALSSAIVTRRPWTQPSIRNRISRLRP
jgi:hypothetical protein